MRFCCSIAVLSVFLATPALASGVDIAWDNCLGESGATSLKAFACNTNSGQESLWISFESSEPASTINKLEVAIRFQTQSGSALPVWWDFEDLASCRRNALSVDPDPPYETPICTRPTGTGPMPLFVVDRIDYQFPSADEGTMVIITQIGNPLVANQRYLACRFLLSHAKTSACAGCNEPVSITVTGVRAANMTFTNAITQNFALWQSRPTGTRATTWSALKRLYR
jgi:hypothetical protein